jgi:hypothetical protein
MAKIIKLITFIPWILYFIEIMLYRINVIEEKSLDKSKYFKYLNKNLFSSINVKELVLFCIFIIFMQYEKTLVLEILFPAIYVYLLIDFFHTLAVNCKKIKNVFLMVETVILVVLVIGFFLITNHLYTTYVVMFAVSLLSSFLIYVFSAIYSLFPKKAISKK